MSALDPAVLQAAARRIRLVIFDVDGVLTNGQLLLGPAGEEWKVFHVRDGQGLVMLQHTGIAVGIITGRHSAVVATRMAELGIEYVYQGQQNKLVALDDLRQRLGLELAEICYVGDDLPDLAVLQRVGLPVSVADGHPHCVAAAAYCTQAGGGNGAARELCEFIMDAQGTLAGQYARYAG